MGTKITWRRRAGGDGLTMWTKSPRPLIQWQKSRTADEYCSRCGVVLDRGWRHRWCRRRGGGLGQLCGLHRSGTLLAAGECKIVRDGGIDGSGLSSGSGWEEDGGPRWIGQQIEEGGLLVVARTGGYIKFMNAADGGGLYRRMEVLEMAVGTRGCRA